MKSTSAIGLVVVAGVALAGIALWYVQRRPPVEPTPVASTAAPPVAAPQQPASEPAVRYPIESEAAQPPLAAGEIAPALQQLLGHRAMSLVATDDFPRRVAATVDNLARSQAPTIAWPVTPTPGRFTVIERDGATFIAADNAARYAPFVRMVEGVDAAKAGALYRRMYPLLQGAYRELGFPRAHFNDRLVDVIDQLLATPQPQQPLRVQLVEVKGPVAPERPWVRYELADPQLQSLSAGQKILLRVGPDNERRLKAKLAQLRAELVRQ